jgi:hypothetical protein
VSGVRRIRCRGAQRLVRDLHGLRLVSVFQKMNKGEKNKKDFFFV